MIVSGDGLSCITMLCMGDMNQYRVVDASCAENVGAFLRDDCNNNKSQLACVVAFWGAQ